MNSLPAPLPMPPANAIADAGAQCSAEDEIPLGWECANPALQIERWGMEAAGAAEDLR
jgi:hypothetical protein